MADFTILAMTGDADWLRRLRSDLVHRGGVRIVVTTSIDEACDLLDSAAAKLLAVDLDSSGVSIEQMDRLLWTNSIQAHPATVLAATADYAPETALMLFQMGVDDYISKSEHGGQIASIVGQLVKGRPVVFEAMETCSLIPQEIMSAGESSLAMPARWVAAASPA